MRKSVVTLQISTVTHYQYTLGLYGFCLKNESKCLSALFLIESVLNLDYSSARSEYLFWIECRNAASVRYDKEVFY